MEKIAANTERPISSDRLVKDLHALGVEPGMCLLAHTSLSRIGWVPGGTQSVALALLEAVGDKGTITVPSQSSDLSEPSHFENPHIPKSWFQAARAAMPAFDPATTPSRGVGKFPETLRNWPGAHRSNHPHTSFASVGHLAKTIVARHDLDSPLGVASPLQALYDLDASILFIGTDYSTNTAFHLAEDSLQGAPTIEQGAPMLVDGAWQWVTFTSIDYDETDFPQCGDAFEKEAKVSHGLIGHAPSRLFRLRSAVNFARKWLSIHRT